MSNRANIVREMASVKWKLSQYMKEHGVSAYALGMKLGGHTRISTVYRLASETKEPTRVDFQTLAEVIEGLREITGKPVNITDLVEYQE